MVASVRRHRRKAEKSALRDSTVDDNACTVALGHGIIWNGRIVIILMGVLFGVICLFIGNIAFRDVVAGESQSSFFFRRNSGVGGQKQSLLSILTREPEPNRKIQTAPLNTLDSNGAGRSIGDANFSSNVLKDPPHDQPHQFVKFGQVLTLEQNSRAKIGSENTSFSDPSISEYSNEFKGAQSTRSIRKEKQSNAWQLKSTLPHDPRCFTQALEFLNDELLLRTCGLYRQSRVELLKYSPSTNSLTLMQRKLLPANHFAEGAVLRKNFILVTTWREHAMHVFKEGWGLAYDSNKDELIATDGSDVLYIYAIHDDPNGVPKTISLKRSSPVRLNDKPLPLLNELEWLGDDSILANVWYSSTIHMINTKTGLVTRSWDMGPLVAQESSGDVLNGIAIPPSQKPQGSTLLQSIDVFVTGKSWNKVYHTNFAF